MQEEDRSKTAVIYQFRLNYAAVTNHQHLRGQQPGGKVYFWLLSGPLSELWLASVSSSLCVPFTTAAGAPSMEHAGLTAKRKGRWQNQPMSIRASQK